MLGPFDPFSLSAGLLTNLASDILKHKAHRLEGTRAGQVLKSAGLIDPKLEDRLQDTIAETLL
jgi:hypothetical protein